MPLWDTRENESSARRSRFPWPVSLAVVLTAVLFFAWPSQALALPRPHWDPGPPWAPLLPGSPEMRQIRDLFWIMLFLSAIVFFGVCAVIIICITRFTAKDGDTEGRQIYGSRNIEVAWTAVPFIVLVLAFAFTVKAIHDINTPPAYAGKPLDINAIGHQWWWEIQYPSLGVVTANEIHVPVGAAIHFHVESADVVHSFWVPQLQRQIDANPGQDNAVYTVMDHVGTYAGMCYEFCGNDHAWMKFKVFVQPRAAFNAWVTHEKTKAATSTSSLLAYGRKVFLQNTCVDCHAVFGTPAGGAVGPNLTHLGSRWTIGASAAPMTMSDLETWIRDPNTYKPGVNMPGYPVLSQKDLHALAAYLLSLK